MRRLLTALIATGLLAGPAAAPALADQASVCAQAGGAWREHGEYPRHTDEARCEFQESLSDDRTVSYSSPVPGDMLGDEWVESQLAAFIKSRFAQLRSSIPSAPQTSVSGDIDEHHDYRHSASVQSLVFHETVSVSAAAHPNDECLTLTFDLAEHRQLRISDLFKAGTNIPATITPLVLRDAKQGTLGQLSIGTYNDGSYSAFALTPTDLVVYLPAERVGAVNAGAFSATIPLSAFGDTLRPEYRSS
ncbi:hypothetical protein Srot_0267 [Segniliparus rotundus DSM 44985]|uniref:DUF3298 domain-containing protein n=1 Tax=Segniliparus rotundus (strain ATCC BAA-972 / CDC 1076 / CIP 108378 / DSM 44985 / JCM 13578) TaxID=640132 RepID=D6ZAZ5_SEGRD|nr:DUF3298 domain-containing protein [Segniliparus rotundus]ADG96754.1 hypothetical protein Srot_0267 [Segniliparus rotundus DSM 44985]